MQVKSGSTKVSQGVRVDTAGDPTHFFDRLDPLKWNLEEKSKASESVGLTYLVEQQKFEGRNSPIGTGALDIFSCFSFHFRSPARPSSTFRTRLVCLLPRSNLQKRRLRDRTSSSRSAADRCR